MEVLIMLIVALVALVLLLRRAARRVTPTLNFRDGDHIRATGVVDRTPEEAASYKAGLDAVAAKADLDPESDHSYKMHRRRDGDYQIKKRK